MIKTKSAPDAESVRRRELISLQEEMQVVWDKIEQIEWFRSKSKKNEERMQQLWEEFERMEILERQTLKSGSLMIHCTSCGDNVWDSRNFFKERPYCESCFTRKSRK